MLRAGGVLELIVQDVCFHIRDIELHTFCCVSSLHHFSGYIAKQFYQFSKSFSHNLGPEDIEETF